MEQEAEEDEEEDQATGGGSQATGGGTEVSEGKPASVSRGEKATGTEEARRKSLAKVAMIYATRGGGVTVWLGSGRVTENLAVLM